MGIYSAYDMSFVKKPIVVNSVCLFRVRIYAKAFCVSPSCSQERETNPMTEYVLHDKKDAAKAGRRQILRLCC